MWEDVTQSNVIHPHCTYKIFITHLKNQLKHRNSMHGKKIEENICKFS